MMKKEKTKQQTLLIPTRNALDHKIKLETIETLNQFVVDLIDLAMMTKQAHWNMRGDNFMSVHQMLDGFRDTLLDHQDTFAERVVQLGGTAIGTSEAICKLSRLSPYPIDIHHVTDHLSTLAQAYALVANNLRVAAKSCQDEDAIDMLVAASRDLDKQLWFIEAHIS